MSEEGRPLWFGRDTEPIWRKHFLDGHSVSPITPVVERYLEIGTAAGDSLIWCLENLHPKLAVSVDPYIAPRKRMQATYDAYKKNAAERLRKYAGQVALFYEPSDKWLMRRCMQDDHEWYDLIFVDGDHNGVPALTDMILSWRLLKLGGIMIVDDLHRRWHHGRSKVREAWRAWCDVFEDEYAFLYREPHQAAVYKVRT